jgi:MFS family permease
MREEAQGPAKAAKPPSFAALRHKDARPYLFGSAMAMMADNIEHVITYWIMYEKFHSPALAGFAIFSHWIPFLLFSVYAGAIADRFDPRRVIQGSMLLFMSVSLAWGVLIYTDALEMWHAGVLLVIHGFAGVLWAPSSQLIIHEIVGKRSELQSGVRLLATSRTLGSLLGPGVGGGLLILFGPTYGLFANVLIYCPLLFWLWKAPYGPKFRKEHKPTTRAVRGFGDVVSTMKLIAGNRVILSMTLLAGASSLIVGNGFQAQMPEFAHDLGHNDADLSYSMLLGANAAGAVLGGLILEARGLLPAKPSNAVVLVILWCFSIAAFAWTTSYPVAVSMMFAAGFLNLAFASMGQTLVQLSAPEEIRGRVIGLYNMASMGLRAFSGVTVGVGGSLIGIHWSLALSAMVLLTAATTIFALMIRTRALAPGE